MGNPYTGQASFEVKVLNKGGYLLPWHIHDAYEFTYIVKGIGQRIIGSQIDTFEHSDMVLLGPQLPHSWQDHAQQANEQLEAVTIRFDKDFPTAGFMQLPEMAAVQRLLEQSKRGVVIPEQLKPKLIPKLRELNAITPARQLLSILDILLTISESETSALLPEDAAAFRGVESKKTKLAIDHIFSHYPEPVSLDRLAEIAGVHPSSLGRLFKKNTGFTPTEFINQVRINHASNLLVNSSLPILEVATQSGYQNLSYFNRIFKLLKGTSPSQYKKQAKGCFG